ncbi:MAG: hypothetical protein LBT69_04820 [Lactobacillales bacterium]|jgi:hypothetical protein|nr:hypothetical protein [Lactobacillales bacterium]
MKRVICVLLIFEFCLFAFTSSFVSKEFAQFCATKLGGFNVAISDDPSSTISQKEKIAGLNLLAKEYNFRILNTIYKSNKEKHFYTNDLSMDGWLSSTKFNKVSGTKYLSNESASSKKKVDNLRWFTNQETIRLYSLDGRYEMGLNGDYQIFTSNRKKLKSFCKKLENRYHLIAIPTGTHAGKWQLLIQLLGLPIAEFVLLSLFLITSYCFLFYLICQSKRQSLQILYGYTRKQQLFEALNVFLKTISMGFGFSVLYLIIEGVFHQLPLRLIGYGLFGIIVMSVVILTVLFLLCLLWIYHMNRINTLNNYIKEKSVAKPFLIVSKVFVLIFLMIFPYTLSGVVSSANYAYQNFLANQVWQQAENVYRPAVATIGIDSKNYKKNEELFRNFYRHNYDRLALISSNNYGEMGGGFSNKKLYQMNTHGQIEEVTSPSGRCLRINTTYLQWNPIVDECGEKITKNRIDFAENSYTALVPQKLKKYSDKIKQELVKDYQSQCDKKGEIPKLHLIFVKNYQHYFTYDSSISSQTKNKVMDPLVIVDIGNTYCNYGAFMTSSIFFRAKEGVEGAYAQITPTLKQEKLLDFIPAVRSVYDERAKEIQFVRQQMFIFYFFTALSVVILIFCIYCFNRSLYEKNQKRIRLKFLSGYPLSRIFQDEFLLWMLLDTMIFIGATAVFARAYFWLSVLGMILMEMSLFYLMIRKKGVVR